jgi:HK97 family phage prohead protease
MTTRAFLAAGTPPPEVTMHQAPTDNLVRQLFVDDEVRAATTDDGSTLFGHFAVFDRWTTINSWFEGNFRERIAPGAFARTLKERAGQIRVLYDHGHDPQIGNKPIGAPLVVKEDARGAYYEVELFDASYVNDLVPALRSGQMGASFRMRVVGEEWVEPRSATKDNPAKLKERTITDVDLFEFGPVTFPAYAEASAGVRSGTDQFFDRLTSDPLFVARLSERLGLRVVEQMVGQAADGAAREATPDEPADGRNAGFNIHIARAQALAHTL